MGREVSAEQRDETTLARAQAIEPGRDGGDRIGHHLPPVDGAALSVGAALAGVALAMSSGGGALASGLVVPTGADEQTARAAALNDETVRRCVGEAPPRRGIYVPGKLVNVVV